MTVTVETSGGDGEYWQPDTAQLKAWSQATMDTVGRSEHSELSLRLVGSSESAHLNNEYRGKDSPTNVLSFPVEASTLSALASLPPEFAAEAGLGLLGDIVICPEVVEREAAAQGKAVADHWAHLLVHGILHLLGHVHDEPEQAAAMESLEIETLQKLGISNPYLIG